MLQFIVLGMIPGTHIQVTFDWVLLIVALASLAVVWRLESARLIKWLNAHSKHSNLTTNGS